MIVFTENCSDVSKLGHFYQEEIRDRLENHGIVRLKLNNIPFGVNNRKLCELKKFIKDDFGPEFRVEKSDGLLIIDRTQGPVPHRKMHRPAYVNNR